MRTIEEFVSRQTEIRSRLSEIDTEFAGEALSEEVRAEWNSLNDEFEANDKLIGELRARQERVRALADSSANTERGADFTVRSRKSESDIYDLAQIRSESRSDSHHTELLRDAAKRSLEISTVAHEGIAQDTAKEHVERLLERDSKDGEIARHLIATGSPVYRRAFAKAVASKELTSEERTALGIASGGIGGYAIPYTLDPTVIPTSDSTVNPYRSIARVVTLTGSNTWQGVSSAGVTASFDLEAAEVSDDSPTFVQPTATARMARAFVQFSMELDDDWTQLQSEMAMLFQDAKDNLEGTAFTTGSGTAPNPLGIVETANTAGIGTAAFVFTAGTAAFVVGDVYALENALAPRWRSRASFVGNRAVYNAIRGFGAVAGANVWVDNLRGGLDNRGPVGGSLGQNLLAYPTYESSVMASTPITSTAKTLLFGDFRQFVIVDRIGMSVEPVQHMFHTSNNLPSGQRGLLARWRTGSTVAAPTAFKLLKVL